MQYLNELTFAREMDLHDPLHVYRKQFHFPVQENGESQLYFCGNSLGLQPKRTDFAVNDILENWKNLAVEGHFVGDDPWIPYVESIKPMMAEIVGARQVEIAIANTLTVNLHLLMVSFYRPDKNRYKILIEGDAFPSDKYVVASQARMHGFDPQDAILEVLPKKGTHSYDTDDLASVLDKNKGEVALILLGGINYFTGQFIDIPGIVRLGHQHGCQVGIDLAHAAGNVPLELHEWKVDFAAWCNYKYLNSGPGSIGSFFIHEAHFGKKLLRMEGWWGNHLENRFLMEDKFVPEIGAEAWVQSTPPTLAIAPIRASLELFDEIGMANVRQKSIRLTGFLEFLINDIKNDRIEIITPVDPLKRGSQLSVRVKNADKSLFHSIMDRGAVVDWREPDVIRVSPAPIYNSFEDVFRFVEILKDLISK